MILSDLVPFGEATDVERENRDCLRPLCDFWVRRASDGHPALALYLAALEAGISPDHVDVRFANRNGVRTARITHTDPRITTTAILHDGEDLETMRAVMADLRLTLTAQRKNGS